MEDLREQRGIVLAATKQIHQHGDCWIVPSQSGKGVYAVRGLAETNPECSCPDYEARRQNCKHIYAAIFVSRREHNADGSTTVTETIALTRQRTTYPQAWPAYNAAQTNEKDKFLALLFDLCRGIENPETRGAGRPRLPLSDAVFSAAFKVYSTVSGRRFMSDLRDAQTKGFIASAPHYNSIFNYLENPAMTPVLRNLVEQSSLPLRSVETSFAVDSSGFTTSRFTRWFDVKYGKERIKQDWVKCHLMCGVKTNIVTAVEIEEMYTNDTLMFAPMVETTAKSFRIGEVSADKAYGSRTNTDVVAKFGGTPFIAFKGTATGAVGGTFEKMFHYFLYRKEDFLGHYHARSNAESTFSMMKRKFGDGLRSKTDVAMVNETLCKVLCHNLVVLIHEMYELGIEPMFYS
ncbi:MAG: transposase [Candidatus Korobacteraceae bacterium]|jgi:transposase